VTTLSDCIVTIDADWLAYCKLNICWYRLRYVDDHTQHFNYSMNCFSIKQFGGELQPPLATLPVYASGAWNASHRSRKQRLTPRPPWPRWPWRFTQTSRERTQTRIVIVNIRYRKETNILLWSSDTLWSRLTIVIKNFQCFHTLCRLYLSPSIILLPPLRVTVSLCMNRWRRSCLP